MVSGFAQVSEKGLRIRQTLGLNAVYELRKEPGLPCRVTCLATGKGGTDKTGGNSPSFIYADLSSPAPTQVPALWLARSRRSGGA